MKHKTKLLLLAVMCILVLPLVFANGNAWAINPVTSSTYNPDAAIHDATSGGWDLPSNFFCVGPPASWDGTGATQSAVERDDLAAKGSNPVAPATDCGSTNTNCCSTKNTAIPAAVITAVKALTADQCIQYGYSYSSYSGSCSAAGWTTTDPDYVSGNTNIEPWYTDHKGCLRCHNTVYMATHDPSAAKETYLQGGHKNMLQKADGYPVGYPTGMNPSTPPYIGNSATVLTTDAAGDAFNWASAGLSGTTPYNATYTPAGGSAIPLYWVAGFSGLEGNWPHAIADDGSSYSCGRCHATGWSSDANPNTAKEPEFSFPGVSSSTSTAGHHGVYLGGSIATDTNKYASWDRWGIQCSRCHYATGAGDNGHYGEPSGGHTTFPENGVSTGGDINALCMNCHRQETGGLPNALESAGFLNASCKAAGSPYTCCTGSKTGTCNQSDTNPGGTLYISPNVYTNGVLTTLGSFSGHSHANQFLNSPHAEFTGTWGQIGCPPVSYSPAGTSDCSSDMSQYGSAFVNYTGSASGSTIITQPAGQGGACTACHDVHNTVIDNAEGQDAKGTAACTSCHSSSTDAYAPQVSISTIRHPNTTGTPFDSTLYGAPADPCAVCHMPGGQHIFRISTDPSYVEFPAGSPVAATAPNDDGVNVTWVDLDAACGQCHGGSAGATATKNGAPYMSKASLATYAATMHNGVSTAPVTNPQVGCGTGVQITAGGVATITPSVTTGSASGETVVVAWGDGVVARAANGSGSPFTHTYATTNPLTSNGDGTFNVTVTAIAPDGGMGSVVCSASMPAGSSGYSGTVKDGSGNPLGGAYVWLQRTDGSGHVLNTYVTGVDKNGNYSFTKIALGTYSAIWVTKSHYSFTCSSAASACDPNTTDLNFVGTAN
jgi:predicted CXXCH cytochrome family protein